MAKRFAIAELWPGAMTWASGVENVESRIQSLKLIFNRSWDGTVLRPEVLEAAEAAEAAGLGEAARAFRPN